MLARRVLGLVLAAVRAAKLAGRGFLILGGAVGVAALLAEHFPLVRVEALVGPLPGGVLVPASRTGRAYG